MLDLKNLSISNHQKEITDTIRNIVYENKAPDSGINPIETKSKSDVCINGMFLNYASYFETNENDLTSIVDFILSQQMKDGGFNCSSTGKGQHIVHCIPLYPYSKVSWNIPSRDIHTGLRT